MPCMCGDSYCSSCGPAQGNSRCPSCGKWSADGGCDNPEKCAEAAREEADAYAKELQWEKDHADEIAEAIKPEALPADSHRGWDRLERAIEEA